MTAPACALAICFFVRSLPSSAAKRPLLTCPHSSKFYEAKSQNNKPRCLHTLSACYHCFQRLPTTQVSWGRDQKQHELAECVKFALDLAFALNRCQSQYHSLEFCKAGEGRFPNCMVLVLVAICLVSLNSCGQGSTLPEVMLCAAFWVFCWQLLLRITQLWSAHFDVVHL